MKQIISISFAVIILLSGMNLTIATHYCRGEIAATKISFSDKPASCGMESGIQRNSSFETIITTHCCEDEIASCTVDSNYAPSEVQLNTLQSYALQIIEMPAGSHSYNIHYSSSLSAATGPPGTIMAHAVFRSEICIFRI